MTAIIPGTLPPSDAERWANCAFSFALQAQYPQGEVTQAQREGVAADWLAMKLVEQGGIVETPGGVAPNGISFDQEMIDAARCFANDVSDAEAQASPQASLRVQAPVTMHRLVHLHNEGRPDVFLIDMVRRSIIIWEFKYGYRFVDPYMNLAMLDYLAGIFEGYDLSEADLAGVKISLRVVQPRNYQAAGPVRVWDTTPAVVFERIRWLAQRAALAKQHGAHASTGPWCLDCSGNTHCTRFLDTVSGAVDQSGKSLPHDMSPEATGAMLTLLDTAAARIKALRDGLDAEASALIRKGTPVRGWHIKRDPTPRRWTVPVPEVLALGEMMGLTLTKEAEAITPAQAVKLGLDEALVDTYAQRFQGAEKLAPISATAAEKAFSK
jgi:hypothetical protein